MSRWHSPLIVVVVVVVGVVAVVLVVPLIQARAVLRG
jgi:hypothetical protein